MTETDEDHHQPFLKVVFVERPTWASYDDFLPVPYSEKEMSRWQRKRYQQAKVGPLFFPEGDGFAKLQRQYLWTLRGMNPEIDVTIAFFCRLQLTMEWRSQDEITISLAFENLWDEWISGPLRFPCYDSYGGGYETYSGLQIYEQEGSRIQPSLLLGATRQPRPSVHNVQILLAPGKSYIYSESATRNDDGTWCFSAGDVRGGTTYMFQWTYTGRASNIVELNLP